MKNKKFAIILLAVLCVVIMGIVFFLYYKRGSLPQIPQSEEKQELTLAPRPVLQPLADANAEEQQSAAVLYGTIAALSDNMITIKEQFPEEGKRDVYTVQITDKTGIMQSRVNKEQNSVSISATPSDDKSFTLRIGLFVEIAYHKGADGATLVADRIIFSE